MTNSPAIRLRGVTWKHTRGLLPMLATAQRFEELHPGVEIAWETRSLQSFADEPLEKLALRYDLLVIDHPSSGRVAQGGVLLPLNEVISSAFLLDQAENSVGSSYNSYVYGGHLWALPIDAAAPVSLCRPDLLKQKPQTWEDMMELASSGRVVMPGLAIDSLMNFFMLCVALGEEPFTTDDQVVTAPIGEHAMQLLRELLLLCPPKCLQANPIAICNMLSSSNRAAYCPFAYGYSNYSRPGYGGHIIEAGELVAFRGQALRSTLGGAGLAISASCRNVETAVLYAQYVAGQPWQRTLYFDAGGQPGHRAAWLDPEVNRRSNGFFERTLPVLDRAYVRPRFPGYLDFQQNAAESLHCYLTRGGQEKKILTEMNDFLSQAHSRGNEAK